MANWHLNYGINLRGGGSDEMKCNVSEKGGNGIELVMGGAIPDGAPVGVAEAIGMVAEKAQGLDGLPAGDVNSHKAYLQAIIDFCTELRDGLGE